ncbi:MAG: haloacid dehalogenase [Actinobacteria bacterium 13_1_20CM_4_66_15]|nr:MAG: haloacid dehalogenase [Actinobacteria bacterium 13_1_20CM_4_66_15]
MSVRVVGFDGDDTLWHSETRFHVTQGEFRDLLKRHVPDADVDRRLAEMEMKNLGIYGYGVKSFTLSMLETAIELTEGRIPTSDLEVILGWGKGMLMEPTELLDGVEETLRLLGGRYDLLLITKGDLFDQEGKLARSGLGDLFLGVEILSEKNTDSYRGVFTRRAIKPEHFVMVGNSLRSDVVPVVSLGAQAVHIPYEVTWHHEHVPEEELPNEGWQRISSIRELPAILDEL